MLKRLVQRAPRAPGPRYRKGKDRNILSIKPVKLHISRPFACTGQTFNHSHGHVFL